MATLDKLRSCGLAIVLSLASVTAIADWWKDCTAERERFCKGVPTGGGRVADCIDQHSNELSPQCLASRPLGVRSNIGQNSPPSQPSRENPSSIPSSQSEVKSASSGNWHTIYETDFSGEIDQGLMPQGPTQNSITVDNSACQPSKRALKIFIRKQDDYSHVANGVPRGEVGFAGKFTFQEGREYQIQWSTCLPPNFPFDFKQPEGIGQIHVGVPKGTPPWGITLAGDRYQVQLRDGNQVQTRDIGSASQDRGRWVRWKLHYRPDSSGRQAITELEKNGDQVLAANGVPNSYPNDNRAYLKMGIYKWWWQERPSDVAELTMFFGNIIVDMR